MDYKTDTSIDYLSKRSTEETKNLIREANNLRSRKDISNRKMFARMMRDPKAVALAISLSDEVLRIQSKYHASRIFFKASKNASIQGFGLINSIALRLGGVVSLLLPKFVLSLVMLRVKQISKEIILSLDKDKLNKHIEKRLKNEAALNINVLGEAVLGEEEAQQRHNQTIEMMRRKEVNYVSVKISSVCSQIVTVDHKGTLERVIEKLREIYIVSVETETFVNLDMEEFRDLRLTVDAFKILLLEEPFQKLYAGIVLQAYLPESHQVFEELLLWAKDRSLNHGGKIKIRLVKGANLEMEKVESEIQGWNSATYPSKDLVDASYLRLIDIGLRKEFEGVVDLGIASHNLFHLSFALEIAKNRKVLNQMDIEMLEGMANPEALTLSSRDKRVLLYTPVTKDNDFASAVAYLVRRFDENTSPENYLSASFSIADSVETYIQQEDKFINAVSDRHTVPTDSIRHREEQVYQYTGFYNEKNTDMTNPLVREKIQKEIKKVLDIKDYKIPLVIGGEKLLERDFIPSGDPSCGGEKWYEYAVSTKEDVLQAIQVAKNSIPIWNELGGSEIKKILNQASTIMQKEREQLIAIMSRDGGKIINEADIEITEAIDFANFYGLSSIENNLYDDSNPLGVVVVVPPWNFPYAIPAGGIFSALASGNTVIVKPAPETVMTAWLLVQQLWRAGVPKNVLQFVPTQEDEVGQALITHEDVSAVILTGSIDTAELFSSWNRSANIMGETSGKNSIIVTACCDVDLAVKDLVHSAFSHSGQKCSAASIGIIDSSVFRDSNFLKQLKDAVESLSVGPAWNPSTDVSPIINPPSKVLDKALNYLEEGEEWLVLPRKLDQQGYLWSPGVKIGIKPNAWSHKTEWFGPVLGIMESPDLDTSIVWQNDTQYGLTSGIHSLDVDEIEKWIDLAEAGNLYINRGITGAVVNRQPFGGWKKSCYGFSAKAGGDNYITNLRNFHDLTDAKIAIKDSEAWLKNTGVKVSERSNLVSEMNYSKFKYHLTPILVKVGDSTPEAYLEYLEWLSVIFKDNVKVSYSEDDSSEVAKYERIRWLSKEEPPYSEFTILDTRSLCQRGDIEIRRWLLEQSISITTHRYGNTNAGPKPRVLGSI